MGVITLAQFLAGRLALDDSRSPHPSPTACQQPTPFATLSRNSKNKHKKSITAVYFGSASLLLLFSVLFRCNQGLCLSRYQLGPGSPKTTERARKESRQRASVRARIDTDRDPVQGRR